MIIKSHKLASCTIVFLLMALFSCVQAPPLFAQVNIGPGGFTSTTVCASSTSPIPPACQVATNFDATSTEAGALQLTTSLGNQVGSAWTVTPQTVVNGFTSTFTFQFTNPSTPPADGIAFLIQNASTGISAIGFTGGNGGAIGYGGDDANSQPTTGIANSVAIEFDSFLNGWDPNANHLAVQSCGTGFNTSHHNQLCSASGPNSTLGISSALSVSLSDGNVHTVTIQYNAPGTPCNTSNSSDTSNLCIYIDQQNAKPPVPSLTLTVNLSTLLSLGNGGTAYAGFTGATGGDFETQDILSWTFASTVVQTFNLNGTTTSNFSANGNQNTLVFNTQPANDNLTCNIQSGEGTSQGSCGPITLVTTNTVISPTDPTGVASWNQYVFGTPWAPSVCAARPANGGNFCSLFANKCYGGNTNASQSQASDFYCPTVAPGDGSIDFSDTYDPPQSMLTVPNGTTVSLMDFTPSNSTETWIASSPTSSEPSNLVCTNVSGIVTGTPPATTTTPTQCDVSDSLIDVFGDQTTTRGSKPKKGWIITVFDVPMPITSVEVLSASPGCSHPNAMLNDPNPNNTDFGSPNFAANIWNNGSCLLDFVVNPAIIPNSIANNGSNNFQAAPPASLFWGPGDPPVQPGTIPPSGDTPYANPNPTCTIMPYPCTPTPWDIQVSNLTPNKTNIPLSTLGGDGRHTIHYSSSDVVGISEKQIQLLSSGTCYDPQHIGVFTPPCYSTAYYTTQVNIDSEPPTITSNGFSPAGSPQPGTFGVGETVYPVYTCSDQAGLSGIAKCGNVVEGTPGSACPVSATPSPSAFTPLDTSSQGTHPYTETAMDCAGNMTSSLVNYNVLPPAFVAIYEGETTDHPKHGTIFTFVAWTFDWSLQNAYNVNITFTIPLPPGVLAPGGMVTGKVADCSLNGCSAPPGTGRNCTVTPSGNTYTVSCTVGTLTSIFTGHGAVAAVSIPIATTAAGQGFNITGTLFSSGNPNKNTMVSDSITVR